MKKRSYLVALLLSLFTGFLGFDRFYLGKIGTGCLKLLLTFIFGVGLIWWIIDIFYLLYDKQTDINGDKLEGSDKVDPTMLAMLSIWGLNRFYLRQTGLGIAKWGLIFGGIIIMIIGVSTKTNAVAIIGFLIIISFYLWNIVDIYLLLTNKIKDGVGRPIEADTKRYQTAALLFGITFGFWGFDRFYLGHRSIGMLKLFTFGMCGMWVALDLILIILNALRDENNNVLIQD